MTFSGTLEQLCNALQAMPIRGGLTGVAISHAAAETITALTAQLSRLQNINVKLCADFNAMNSHGAKQDAELAAERQAREAQAVEIERLRDALAVFADMARAYDGIPPAKYFGDIDCELRHAGNKPHEVTVDDLRQARAAIAEMEKGK